MKTFKTIMLILAFSTGLLITNCSPSDDSSSDNNPPGLFSANALGTGIDSANVEWTEAIDTDEDPVTYAIILEGQEIASGGTTLTYNFSGLEPDTIYEGYVEARDGNGGTSTANFSFVTEPQVITFNVDASWWIRRQTPEGDGLRTILRAGFVVPFYEDATLYQIEILDYGFGSTTIGNEEIGRILTWTNESQPENIGPVFADQTEPGDYAVAFNGASSNTLGPGFDDLINLYDSVYGEATVTIMIGN